MPRVGIEHVVVELGVVAEAQLSDGARGEVVLNSFGDRNPAVLRRRRHVVREVRLCGNGRSKNSKNCKAARTKQNLGALAASKDEKNHVLAAHEDADCRARARHTRTKDKKPRPVGGFWSSFFFK